MTWLLVVLLTAVLVWAVARFGLQGEDLGRFDVPRAPPVSPREQPSPEHRVVVASLAQILGEPGAKAPRRARLATMRRQMDRLSDSADLRGIRIDAVQAGDVPAEWVRGPDSDPARRLLYIHGGAFTMGSPRSHRVVTAQLARITGCSVLAIDYRLMPEHSRRMGIDDCRAAYRWMLEHGPDGATPAHTVFVAGDSAGGNLTLMLIAWARDEGIRQADAAVALSPSTDGTMSSASLTGNIASDPLLGPAFSAMLRIPRALLLWGAWLSNRINPRDPVISPVYGDLSGLPPVLVQASEAEMLIDDARRWVNKARAAGSPATLETWPHMVHVWQAFGPALPESEEAYTRIARFLAAHAGVNAGSPPQSTAAG